VRSLWSNAESAAFEGELGERVYTSRLLGADPALVMHGGGNTSVKLQEPDVFGHIVDVLYVKGSGSDLASVTAAGFAPVRLAHLLQLAQLPELSDAAMAEQLRLACTRAEAPAPSVEAILHAIIPARYVDHTHADALLSITNTPRGRELVEAVYGDRVVIVDYVMPGFALARRCAVELAAQWRDDTVGMVLLQHGLFSFGGSARESYERMIELVTLAEEFLAKSAAWDLATTAVDAVFPDRPRRVATAALRRDLSEVAGAPMIVTTTSTPRTRAFLVRDDAVELAGRGPMTPDHVIRTKRLPMFGRDVHAYARAYEAYFERQRARTARALTMLDPAPRVVVDPELGLLTAGRTARDAAIAADIALHTIDAIERADALDDWLALPEGDLFDVEYWELEQAKLARTGAPPVFAGEVALVTGGASGIGRATVAALRAQGAAVVTLDRNPAVEAGDAVDCLGVECDVTDEDAVARALDAAVARFGGLDMLVLNAGVFPPSAPVDSLAVDAWRRVMAVNVDANLGLLRACSDLLACAPQGGRVVVNASKNVAAPGPGQAAYSASKAALTQLARVAALEWGPRGIRVNVVHPNAVFDTGIWDEQALRSRAESYGLTVEQYRTNNLLGVEITSRDVADVIVALCSPTFARTTGAQIPVDGGNDRVV
jgi:rhamnose utilization protein RhaD (predicted bifunctional aldolase and dehydrogenase)/NAD(P)-dependent dehydrogenase (short-subunit alcohol dehydrogenase family)